MSTTDSALSTLLDAIDRQRCLFAQGHVLVEFDRDYVPHGPITMVLDSEDIGELRKLGHDYPGRIVVAMSEDDLLELARMCVEPGYLPDKDERGRIHRMLRAAQMDAYREKNT